MNSLDMLQRHKIKLANITLSVHLSGQNKRQQNTLAERPRDASCLAVASTCTMGHFTFWISPFAQRNRYVTHMLHGVIIVGIYMSSNIYYYYTIGERSDANE